VFSPIAGWWHVASGQFDTCMVVAEEKMSPLHPHPQYAFWSIFDHTLERPLGVTLLWIFALEMRRYMQAYGIKEEEIALVAVKNKLNALDHPCAQLGAKITVEDVMRSEKIAWPVKRYDVSPPSDGAAAMVLASEDVARRYTDDPVWIDGVGWNVDTQYWTDRDLAYPEYLERAARMAYRMAKIEDPRKDLDFAEVYDPFDYKELHHMEGLLLAERGEAPELTKDGVTQRDGDFPVGRRPDEGLRGVLAAQGGGGQEAGQEGGEQGARPGVGRPPPVRHRDYAQEMRSGGQDTLDSERGGGRALEHNALHEVARGREGEEVRGLQVSMGLVDREHRGVLGERLGVVRGLVEHPVPRRPC